MARTPHPPEDPAPPSAAPAPDHASEPGEPGGTERGKADRTEPEEPDGTEPPEPARSEPAAPDRPERKRGRTQTPAPGPRPGARRDGRHPVLLVALALAVVAAVAAAVSGWAWYGAAHDDDAAFARTRDTVLAAGEQAVQNLNTLAYTDLDHGLDIWESSTTGDLHTQLTQGRSDFAAQVRQAQTTSTAKVLSGAVTELDTRTGKASVMVALRITVQAPKAAPAVKESRMLGELTRTADGWKLSALGQAPMGDSAPDPAAGGPTAAPTGPQPTTPQPTASR